MHHTKLTLPLLLLTVASAGYAASVADVSANNAQWEKMHGWKEKELKKSGDWRLVLKISDEGSRSESKFTALYYKDKEITPPAHGDNRQRDNINDHIQTPWGLKYWLGYQKWGEGGWSDTRNEHAMVAGTKETGDLLPDPSAEKQK
jgi:hypothetical protein